MKGYVAPTVLASMARTRVLEAIATSAYLSPPAGAGLQIVIGSLFVETPINLCSMAIRSQSEVASNSRSGVFTRDILKYSSYGEQVSDVLTDYFGGIRNGNERGAIVHCVACGYTSFHERLSPTDNNNSKKPRRD